MAFTEVTEIFGKMPEVFNADAAQGLDAVFQYEITGDSGGNWNVVVKDGKMFSKYADLLTTKHPIVKPDPYYL